MQSESGAMTIAEGKHEYKTDVELVLGNQRKGRSYVLRTTLESLSVWKTRNVNVAMSPYTDNSAAKSKDAAVIEGEIWVYAVNSTQTQDIVAAVKIAAKYFKVDPQTILREIYVKNLNVEREGDFTNEAKVKANKGLYTSVCQALVGAAKQLGLSGELQLHVFNHNKNPKLPREDLIDSLVSGGASNVETDTHKPKVQIGSNSGEQSLVQKTNFHLATLKV